MAIEFCFVLDIILMNPFAFDEQLAPINKAWVLRKPRRACCLKKIMDCHQVELQVLWGAHDDLPQRTQRNCWHLDIEKYEVDTVEILVGFSSMFR